MSCGPARCSLCCFSPRAILAPFPRGPRVLVVSPPLQAAPFGWSSSVPPLRAATERASPDPALAVLLPMGWGWCREKDMPRGPVSGAPGLGVVGRLHDGHCLQCQCGIKGDYKMWYWELKSFGGSFWKVLGVSGCLFLGPPVCLYDRVPLRMCACPLLVTVSRAGAPCPPWVVPAKE